MSSANTMSILKSPNWPDARWAPVLANWIGYAAAVIVRFRALAPYVLIELLLPGGSMMALLMWLYRRRENRVGFATFSLWNTSTACVVTRSGAPGLPSPWWSFK